MLDTRNRKDEHIKYAREQFDPEVNSFTDLKIVHHSIGRVNFDDISTEVNILGHTFSQPFYINAMTGGSAGSLDINRKLAIVARETGIAMATGSASAALRDPDLADSFTVVRDENPNGFVLANLGAERSLDDAKRVIGLLEADALQIHLNVPEELIMPEGDREFKNYKDSLAALIQGVEIPVLIKEVGFGMSRETIGELVELGATHIDVSGTGGTNFINVENARRDKQEFDYLNDFGQTTLISLLEAQDYIDRTNIIASGGVKNPFDVIKAISLGAKAVGASAYFLDLVMSNEVDEAIAKIHAFKYELQTIMCFLNAETVADLRKLDIVITGATKEWADARGIDLKNLASRSK